MFAFFAGIRSVWISYLPEEGKTTLKIIEQRILMIKCFTICRQSSWRKISLTTENISSLCKGKDYYTYGLLFDWILLNKKKYFYLNVVKPLNPIQSKWRPAVQFSASIECSPIRKNEINNLRCFEKSTKHKNPKLNKVKIDFYFSFRDVKHRFSKMRQSEITTNRYK